MQEWNEIIQICTHIHTYSILMCMTFDCVCAESIQTMLNFSPLFPNLVCFATESHRSFFTIKIEHEIVPKLHFSGHQKGQCMLDVKKKKKKATENSCFWWANSIWTLRSTFVPLLSGRVQHQRSGYHHHQDLPALRQTEGPDWQHQEVLPHCHYSDSRRQWASAASQGASHWALHHAVWKGKIFCVCVCVCACCHKVLL